VEELLCLDFPCLGSRASSCVCRESLRSKRHINGVWFFSVFSDHVGNAERKRDTLYETLKDVYREKY
jgi:hypothetical protein